ncbi:MAG: DUF1178 family protein [Erythrobacter sp.]|nr:MAG: DUF1178 family protein [Erythrobacter sp.]
MIVFDLSCANGHRFEGWFGSSGDFASQRESGKLLCPQCGSANVAKAPMAPAVGKKGNQRVARPRAGAGEAPSAPGKALTNAPMPPEVAQALEQLAQAQAKALKDSKWVGKDFANQSRAMHYGEQDHAPIHGEASAQEARELLEEGVPVAPLPFPFAPPDKLN